MYIAGDFERMRNCDGPGALRSCWIMSKQQQGQAEPYNIHWSGELLQSVSQLVRLHMTACQTAQIQPKYSKGVVTCWDAVLSV